MFVIYEIKNILNKRRYIGCSSNFKRRFIEHKKDLINNKHHCTYLQNAWNKYGGECFEFNIIDYVDNINSMYEKEKDIISHQDLLYNIHAGGLGGDRITNHPNKKEIIEKQRSIIIERLKSKEERDRLNPFANLNEEETIARKKVWSDCKKGPLNNKFKYDKPVNQIDINTGEVINTYPYARILDEYGFNPKYIINCCIKKKGYNKHKGYRWEFKSCDG